MSGLIMCPRCSGTGQVKSNQTAQTPQKRDVADFIDTNLADFTRNLGRIKKGTPAPYRTCPECNGFGMVRAK